MLSCHTIILWSHLLCKMQMRVLNIYARTMRIHFGQQHASLTNHFNHASVYVIHNMRTLAPESGISSRNKQGFDDRITSTNDVVGKHSSHPSVMKIRQQYGNGSTFRFNLVDENCVALILCNINPRKATGYDHIPGKIVRIANQELSFPITRLINTATTANAFPSKMKFAEISPGHKKDDNLITGNYRPVSVLPILSKVYETVMNDQLFGYFLVKFHEFLSAFRKRYSCQSILLKAVDDWKYVLDQNLKTGVVFMDLLKAFDCLPHSLLIAKLHAYGADWSTCERLADYLSHRLQRVKIGTARSSWAELYKVVPQGSILGPFLFNIFVNDLFLFVEKCTLYNYADDNSMSYSSSTLQGVLSSLHNDCKSPLSGLVIMEWKRTLQNFNLWYCHQTRLMTSNWNWMRIPYLSLKYQSRPWESS